MHIGDLSILAVEDHEFQRGVLLKVLAGLGATNVRSAADGRGALKIVKAQDPPVDIIVSDLDMPGMDGMEFMRHLGEAGVRVSFIIASSMEHALLASVQTMAKAYGVGILGSIKKPVTPEKLDALIKLHKAGPSVPEGVHSGTPGAGPVFTLEEIAEGLRNDEFEPLFQPQVELATGRVHGAEALARWRHPQQGLVLPSAFMSLLEASDQTDALTRLMLRRSAAFCRKWRALCGLDLTVSVNLSIRSLDDVHLAERVTELVHSENLDPRHMVLELTESATTTEVAHVLENLSRLRMKGFGLSIDNYGTRNSTMQQLARIPFTEMKIDASFVSRAAAQPSARIILESSLALAAKLSMASVAVGIQNEQDWALVRLLGCQLGQGYFTARPMQADALLGWTTDRIDRVGQGATPRA
jgi:EAL domain-containing protein (putative c-di-GMP-specific phosphodiesterase class I)